MDLSNVNLKLTCIVYQPNKTLYMAYVTCTWATACSLRANRFFCVQYACVLKFDVTFSHAALSNQTLTCCDIMTCNNLRSTSRFLRLFEMWKTCANCGSFELTVKLKRRVSTANITGGALTYTKCLQPPNPLICITSFLFSLCHGTHSSTLVTLIRLFTSSSVRITDRYFQYALPRL